MMGSMTRTDEELASAAAALRHSTTRFFRLMRRQAETGMTPSQLAALATIDGQGPLPIGRLAELEGIAAPTATKIVDQLVDAKLVVRTSDESDRRIRQLSVTEEGKAFLARVRDRRTAWLVKELAEFTDDDFTMVLDTVDLLERLIAAHSDERSPLKN